MPSVKKRNMREDFFRICHAAHAGVETEQRSQLTLDDVKERLKGLKPRKFHQKRADADRADVPVLYVVDTLADRITVSAYGDGAVDAIRIDFATWFTFEETLDRQKQLHRFFEAWVFQNAVTTDPMWWGKTPRNENEGIVLEYAPKVFRRIREKMNTVLRLSNPGTPTFLLGQELLQVGA